MARAEQVQTQFKAKDGSHTMKGKQLKAEQEYQFTLLISIHETCYCVSHCESFCCTTAEIGYSPVSILYQQTYIHTN